MMFTCGVHMWFTVYDVRMWHVFRMWSPHVESTCDLPYMMLVCVMFSVCGVHMWSPHMISVCEVHMWFVNTDMIFRMWSPHVVLLDYFFMFILCVMFSVCGVHMWSSHMITTCDVPHVMLVSTCGVHIWFPYVKSTCGHPSTPHTVFPCDGTRNNRKKNRTKQKHKQI